MMLLSSSSVKGLHRGGGKWRISGLKVLVSKQQRLKNLAIFVSGSGSNFRKIYHSCVEGRINGRCVIVVTSHPDCLATGFAQSHDIPVWTYPNKETSNDLDAETLLDTLKTVYEVDFILLAGYLKLIPSELVKVEDEAYPNSILNIHPALLPSFGGKGYYGSKVHEAVLKSGAKFSGPSVHFVNEDYDKGCILDQRVVPVLPNDTVQSLAARVLKQEHELYPECVSALCDGRIKWNNHQVPFFEH